MDPDQEPPDLSRVESALACRLRLIRTELYGKRGGPKLAGRLGLPPREWAGYEGGVTIPGDALLRFLEVTDTEPHWLLLGDGPKYRGITIEVCRDEIGEGTIRYIAAPIDGGHTTPTGEHGIPPADLQLLW